MKHPSDQQIPKLPRWARRHIADLEERVGQLEMRVQAADAVLPRRREEMECFTVLGFERETFTLFRLHENHAEAICSIGPGDCLFMGRPREPAPPPLSVQHESTPYSGIALPSPLDVEQPVLQGRRRKRQALPEGQEPPKQDLVDGQEPLEEK